MKEAKLEDTIYSVEDIKKNIFNILKKYGIKKAYIFGSYARNEANKNSDIDIMIVGGIRLKTLLDMADFEIELMKVLKKNVDVISEEVYSEEDDDEDGELARKLFMKNVMRERILIYE